MTTDEERLENFEKIHAQLDELKIKVAAMRQRQEEWFAEMREDAEKRDRPDEEDGNSDGDGA